MKTITKYGLLFLGLFPFLSFGAAPVGSYTYNVADEPLYDFSGPYHLEVPVNGGTLVLDFALDHQPDGNVDGEGTFSLTHTTGTASGTVAIRANSHESDSSSRGRGRGRGRGGDKADRSDDSNGVVFLNLGIKLNGTGDFGAGSTRVTGNLTSSLTLNNSTGALEGPLRGRINARKSKGIQVNSLISLPTTATGAWDLVIDVLESDSNSVEGTGTFTSSTGQVVEMNLQGVYDPSTDVTVFTLTPVDEDLDDSSDVRIRIATVGDFAELIGLDARLFGQRQRSGDISSDDDDDDDDNGGRNSRGPGNGRNVRR